MTYRSSTKNIRALLVTVALGIASITYLFVATSGFSRTAKQPSQPEGVTGSEVSTTASEPRVGASHRSRGAVSAIGGKAISVSGGPQGLAANDLIVSKPVFKAFALSSDGKELLYSPLKRGIPSGEIWIENLVTGSSRRIASKLVLNAAFSPVDDSKIAYTFADHGSFGLAVIDLSSGPS